MRAGYVDDAWAWDWSSLRELIGAAYPGWMNLGALADQFSLSPRTLLQRLTVAADHHARVPVHTHLLAATLPAIEQAVAAALRIPREAVLTTRQSRRVLAQACYELSPTSTARIATHLAITPRAARFLKTPRHPALPSVLLCLSDPRLRKVDESGRKSAVG